MRLVVPAASRIELAPGSNAPLLKALTRAHSRKEKLFTGQAKSIRAIADEESTAPLGLDRDQGHFRGLIFPVMESPPFYGRLKFRVGNH